MLNIDLNKYIRFVRLKTYNRVDKKLLTYAVFVAIAAVFWLLNKLDNDYNTFIEYPVEYVNLPNDKFLINKLPSNLKLNVSAYGYTLAKYKLTVSPSPIPIDLSDFASQMSSSENNYTLHTKYIKDIINKNIPNDINVSEVLPDTISFHFVDIVTKKIPIVPVTEYSLKPQCFVNGKIHVTPDSVLVSGPITIIDTIKYAYTQIATFKNLEKDDKKSIDMEPIKNVNFQKQKYKVSISVSKFTQAKLKVVINAINVPKAFTLICFPKNTQLTCMVPIDSYNELKSTDFYVQVNYNDIKNLLGNRLPIEIKKIPPGVKQVEIYPHNVEFILEKKQSKAIK